MKKLIRSAEDIFAMSKSRSELESWIEDHTFPTMCAIARLYLFPNCTVRNHWRQEVWSKFSEMHILRRTKRLPNAGFIYSNSWRVNSQFVQNAVDWAIDHEDQLTPRDDIDIQHLSELMDSYFTWLSEILSKNRVLKTNDVYRKLDELGLYSNS